MKASGLSSQNDQGREFRSVRDLPASFFVTEHIVIVPTQADVNEVAVGSLVVNCFGKLAIVVEVFARGTDINGRDYVCFTSGLSEAGSTVTGSYKVGELVRTVPLCQFTSVQLDELERRIVEALGIGGQA